MNLATRDRPRAPCSAMLVFKIVVGLCIAAAQVRCVLLLLLPLPLPLLPLLLLPLLLLLLLLLLLAAVLLLRLLLRRQRLSSLLRPSPLSPFPPPPSPPAANQHTRTRAGDDRAAAAERLPALPDAGIHTYIRIPPAPRVRVCVHS